MSERPFKLGTWVTGTSVSGGKVTGEYDGDRRDYDIGINEAVVIEYPLGHGPARLRTVIATTLRVASK